MELYQEILLNALCAMAPEFDAAQIVESACYQALQKVRAALCHPADADGVPARLQPCPVSDG